MAFFGSTPKQPKAMPAATPVDPSEASLEFSIAQLHYYREDSKRKNIAILVLAAAALLEAAAIFAVSQQEKPADRYFAAGPNMELIAMKPEERPVLNDQQVTAWFGKNVEELFTYSFGNYNEHFRLMATRLITLEAVTDLDAQLEAAGVKRAVTELNLVSKAATTTAPILVQKGVINGNRTWEVSVEGVVNYAGPTKTTGQPVTWVALVTELPQAEGKLRISKIQMKNRQIAGGQ